MTPLTFTSSYGDVTRTVEIRSPFGGGGSFHIMQTLEGHEGMFVIGQVVRNNNGWEVISTAFYDFNKSEDEKDKDETFDRIPFTVDDQQAILDRMIEAGLIGAEEPTNRS